MPELSFHDRQHVDRLFQQQESIKYIFDAFVRKVGVHMAGWTDTGNDDIWIRNKNFERAIDDELQTLREDILANINNYSTDAWNRSNLKADELVDSYIKDLALNDVVKKGMFVRNKEVLKTFLSRKVENVSLSDRIWKISDGAKDNIEFYLQSGLATGRSASMISQDVRQLLKDPDRRFHRIRNADGKLVPSAPMQGYSPGTGVYKSSYKNALRLAATNTNEMYRVTDYDRWQNMPFVLGISISRSPSNRGPCDICDSMVGRYPKDYIFKGWHPWCICIATPILMDQETFMDALINDDWPTGKFIIDIPRGPKNYLDEMLEKKNVSTKSYLFVDNAKFFDQAVNVKGKGSLSILHGVDTTAPDYKGVLASAKGFADLGHSVEILPRVHPKDKRYNEIFGKLKGTKYHGKSPDFSVDSRFYEHEGFRSTNPKNAFRNMLNHGLKQSSSLVIEDCGLSERYMIRNVVSRIGEGQDISELWMLRNDGTLELIYKNTKTD